ncbi:hypothetical protein N7448_003240 [Penicillium atrosanguineum]|uniref:Uncharacterized protein n=1 Tax=Penicillium atrosanguineum TaxID=1132637 RepID=A0A9W9H6Z8_9EURO|nr:uncharacterized protein N7443_002213 [Penicillium atrosanguineum]KAJ5122110.1 hypothetical protein N7526_009047 [Penicillium atrosanguineum]KAJ5139832.1 hypothetical protein N7448_003240 [Penicillium atrosanguineum]KAJ5309752.1 hypothetical protein N7443_002213 [Penicillium atrosanguineum]KAJ5315272.1 hypothetical protein N7476_005579 [Penicillium atrosanguineum]
MGLIKTGLTLAGGYGLIKAASKAAHEYEDKKDKRYGQNQPQSYPNQQYNPGYNQQMGYSYPNQGNNTRPQSQSRSVEPQTKDREDAPPSYYQRGSAQEYYSGKGN